jgi:hypothetical protein
MTVGSGFTAGRNPNNVAAKKYPLGRETVRPMRRPQSARKFRLEGQQAHAPD